MKRLTEIPGVGPMIASALVAAVGDGRILAKGKDLSAWRCRPVNIPTHARRPIPRGAARHQYERLFKKFENRPSAFGRTMLMRRICAALGQPASAWLGTVSAWTWARAGFG